MAADAAGGGMVVVPGQRFGDYLARWAAIGEQADLILADATRETAQSADLMPVAAVADLQRRVARYLPRQFAKSPTQRSAIST